jgi:Short C-terminal domain
MHASTRILLWLVVVIAIVGGWALLFAINDLIPAIIYAVIWTAIGLIVGRVLLAVGLGYNRLTAGPAGGQGGRRQADSATALSELAKMRDQGLITAEEYEAKRTKILERL